jgi:hypothetical protein
MNPGPGDPDRIARALLTWLAAPAGPVCSPSRIPARSWPVSGRAPCPPGSLMASARRPACGRS